jgi:hypothetical protein
MSSRGLEVIPDDSRLAVGHPSFFWSGAIGVLDWAKEPTKGRDIKAAKNIDDRDM